MQWFLCSDCENIFNECQANGRPATQEDCCEPWKRILTCPICNSDQLIKAEICPLCGKPHEPTANGYCEPCTAYVSAGLKSMAWVRGEGNDSEDALKDLICKIYAI
jgi:hypothetical protein